MPRIEITAAIRRNQEDIHAFLHDLANYRQFLPKEHFRDFAAGDAVGGRNAAEFKWKAMGRWWKAHLEVDQVDGHERIVLKTIKSSIPFSWTWQINEMKKDRKGDRAEVHLLVEIKPPGGPLGKMVGNYLMERNLLRVFDEMVRGLEGALGATPRSGLRAR